MKNRTFGKGRFDRCLPPLPTRRPVKWGLIIALTIGVVLACAMAVIVLDFAAAVIAPGPAAGPAAPGRPAAPAGRHPPSAPPAKAKPAKPTMDDVVARFKGVGASEVRAALGAPDHVWRNDGLDQLEDWTYRDLARDQATGAALMVEIRILYNPAERRQEVYRISTVNRANGVANAPVWSRPGPYDDLPKGTPEGRPRRKGPRKGPFD